jgi:hypothetical protein
LAGSAIDRYHIDGEVGAAIRRFNLSHGAPASENCRPSRWLGDPRYVLVPVQDAAELSPFHKSHEHGAISKFICPFELIPKKPLIKRSDVPLRDLDGDWVVMKHPNEMTIFEVTRGIQSVSDRYQLIFSDISARQLSPSNRIERNHPDTLLGKPANAWCRMRNLNRHLSPPVQKAVLLDVVVAVAANYVLGSEALHILNELQGDAKVPFVGSMEKISVKGDDIGAIHT